MLVTLRKIVAIGAIAILTVFGGTATASAQSNTPHAAADVIRLQNAATQRCIDDSNFGFRTNGCNGSVNQQWSTLRFIDDGSYRFQNVSTGRCIDDSDFGFRTNDCNISQYQSWKVTRNGSGWVLQNVATKRCIDDSDFGFRTNICNKSPYQTFAWEL
jgi:hypothetical protein